MNQYQQPTQSYQDHSAPGIVARNRLLRNTYMLLAISMSKQSSAHGLALKLQLNTLLSPGISTIVFFAGAFGLMFLVERNRKLSELSASYCSLPSLWVLCCRAYSA